MLCKHIFGLFSARTEALTMSLYILRSLLKSISCISGSRFFRGFKYLSQVQVDEYNNAGYAVIPNLLSKSELNEARDASDELIKRASEATQPCPDFEFQKVDGDEPRLNRVRFPSEYHAIFDKLQRHSLVLNCVEDLIGSSFRYIAQDKLNFKPAGHGAAIRWHQDWAYFPHTNDSLLTVSVLLDDVTRENGCLQIVRGSHKAPLLSHYQDNKFVQVITESSFDPQDIAYLEAPAGSVTIHHVRAVHGSARNTSTNPRSVVCYIYGAMDAWPLLGVGTRDFKNSGPVDFDLFAKTCVRGAPCLSPRLEKVPVNLPVPFDSASSVFVNQVDVKEPQS